MLGIAVGFVVLLGLSSVPENLDLPDVHVDESAEETYEKRFEFGNAMRCLERVQNALAAPDSQSAEERTIGYRNWLGVLEGVLRKQQFIISELAYELAVRRHEDGVASLEEVGEARDAFEEQRRLFLEFWEWFSIAD